MKQGVNIKTMTISHMAKETFTSAPLLIRIAKKVRIFRVEGI